LAGLPQHDHGLQAGQDAGDERQDHCLQRRHDARLSRAQRRLGARVGTHAAHEGGQGLGKGGMI